MPYTITVNLSFACPFIQSGADNSNHQEPKVQTLLTYSLECHVYLVDV